MRRAARRAEGRVERRIAVGVDGGLDGAFDELPHRRRHDALSRRSSLLRLLQLSEGLSHQREAVATEQRPALDADALAAPARLVERPVDVKRLHRTGAHSTVEGDLERIEAVRLELLCAEVGHFLESDAVDAAEHVERAAHRAQRRRLQRRVVGRRRRAAAAKPRRPRSTRLPLDGHAGRAHLLGRFEEDGHRVTGEGDDVAAVLVEALDQHVEVIRQDVVEHLGAAREAE